MDQDGSRADDRGAGGTGDGLRSPDAGLRRQVAVALGRSGDPAAVATLLDALAVERADEVRASLVLAVGALGGLGAKAALRALAPAGPQETLALAKARDRLLAERPSGASWRAGLALDELCFEVPPGLEHPLGRCLTQDGFPHSETVRPGLLRALAPVSAATLDPLPRYVYNLRVPIASTDASGPDDEAASDLIGRTAASAPWRRWLGPDGHADLRYRFAVEGRQPDKGQFRSWLRDAVERLRPAGLVDSPSAYNCEIVLSWLGPRPTAYFRPLFAPDGRFGYRGHAVHASINPVVAAGLARLVPARPLGAVLDPTCGAGTLLVERAVLDGDARLVGIDVDPDALEAARRNVAAAGLAPRADLRRSDARSAAAWGPCGLVLANLPYGIRSGRGDADLGQLYAAVLANAADHLSDDGRIVLATANRRGLEAATAGARSFQLLARYRVLNGGLHVHVAVLGRARSGSARGGPGRNDGRPKPRRGSTAPDAQPPAV